MTKQDKSVSAAADAMVAALKSGKKIADPAVQSAVRAAIEPITVGSLVAYVGRSRSMRGMVGKVIAATPEDSSVMGYFVEWKSTYAAAFKAKDTLDGTDGYWIDAKEVAPARADGAARG